MSTYITKLQSKSEDARKQILAISLIACMSLVVFVWVYNLGDHFNGQNAEQASSDLKPFKLFANSLKDTYNNISASVGKIQSPDKKADTSQQKQVELVPVEKVQ